MMVRATVLAVLAILMTACASPRHNDGEIVARPTQDIYRCITQPGSPLCPR